jgi:uncharacterized protein (UPF0216 family)
MSKKRKYPGLKATRQILSELQFDANDSGETIGIIAQEGDRNYFERRALELIREARMATEEGYKDRLKLAIQLLMLSYIDVCSGN